MADEPILDQDVDLDQEMPSELIDDREDEDRRSYGTLGTVLLVILIVVVILLFWRSCAADDAGSEPGSSGGVIEEVDGLEIEEGAISLWVKPEADVDTILTRHGLGGAGYLYMGDGTYIVTVSESGIPQNAVNLLKSDPDVYDAGFVYTDEF